MVIAYLVATMFPVFCALVDSEHHLDGDYIEDHTSRVYQRGCFFCLGACLSVVLGIYSVFIFWVLFDGVRSLFVGESFFYIGAVAETDKIASDRKGLYIASKGLSLIVCVGLVCCEYWNISIAEVINHYIIEPIVRIVK